MAKQQANQQAVTNGSTGRHGGAGEDAGGGEPGHPAPARNSVGLLPLWFGLFGAAAAWSVQEIVDYSIAAHTCYPRLYPLDAPTVGRGALWGITIAVSVAMLAVGIAAGLSAVHAWRQTREETGGHSSWALDTGEGRTRFMAMSGLLTSVVFVLGMLVHTATILSVSPCW